MKKPKSIQGTIDLKDIYAKLLTEVDKTAKPELVPHTLRLWLLTHGRSRWGCRRRSSSKLDFSPRIR